MNSKELNEWLEKEIASYPCKTALHMTDADSGEVLHSFSANAVVTSASTIKTPVLLATLDLVDRGVWGLQDRLPLEKSMILPDSEVFEEENLREDYTLWEYLYWMIVNSDNTATNKVLDLVGFDAINAYCEEKLGLTGTRCQRRMLDFEAKEAGRDNLTTAADQCRVYELLYRGKAVSSAMTEVAMDMLLRQRSTSSFLRYIPQPVTLAHKTGGLDYVDHDCGLFWLEDRRVTLSILTWDGPALDAEQDQKRLIGRMAREIYNCYQGGDSL